MSRFWNKRVKGLEPYVPGEQPRDRRYIKLNTNENPYPPSPLVVEAIRKAAGDALKLYPDPEAMALKEAAAKKFGLGTDEVFTGNGSDEILAFAFGALFENGNGAEEVLFPDITYSFYPVYAELWDVPYRTVPLTGDFAIRPEDYRVSSGGVIFPNPNAPTGKALALDEIEPVAAYQLERGRPLIVDEAYVDFGAESLARRVRDYPNLLVVHTLSKSRSLAGLRAAYALGSPELVEGLRRVKDSFNSYTLDRLALAGAVAAIGDETYYKEINRKVVLTRERAARDLVKTGFEVIPSKANFLFIRLPGMGGAELSGVLREKGILTRHFNKERISSYLRVTVGTGEDMDIFLAAAAEIAAETRG